MVGLFKTLGDTFAADTPDGTVPTGAPESTNLTYQPKYMKPRQMNRESGGRQFDAQGKPLVGRYPDGSTPKDSEKAWGISQIQIATAKRTAQKHGIPWSQGKLLNNDDYNLQLGDLHMGDLLQKYGGDEQLALGAYHSGEGRVDRALKQYGRANFAQGLGPVGRKYVGMGKGASGMAGSMPTPVEVEDITKVQATPGEKAALGQPYQGVGNPFDTAGAVKAVDRVQSRASLADAILAQATTESQAIRKDQLQQIDSTVAAKKKLYEHGEETTNALINAATPIFQQRKQILERRKEVAGSNPFVAMVKGVIDPDWNSDALESRDNLLKADLSLLDEEYTHQNKLHENLIGLATAKNADQNVLYNAQLGNLGEDVRLAIQSYEMGGALLDAEMTPFKTDSALLAAQTQQRGNLLSTASTGQINEMLMQADASDNGIVEVQGMPIGKQMLLEEQSRRQEQGYHMGALKLGLMQQNQALVDTAQEKVLKTLNLDQVREGIDNGGIIDGVQFDVVKLGARAQQLREVSQGQAQDSIMATAGGQWASTVNNFTGTTHGYALRLGSMFGTVPDQFQNEFKMQTNRIIQVSQQIKQLAASGQDEAARQLVAATMPELQQMTERRDKLVDEMTTRWAGGNADLKAIGISWAQGTQVEPGAAMRGLVYMARNGAPAGMKFQGTAAKVFQTVRAATQAWDAKQTGEDALKGTAGDRDNALIQQIAGRLGGVFNSEMLTKTLVDAPVTARAVKVNGKVHPFSLVSQEAMSTAIQQGDERGYSVAAQYLGLNDPKVVKQILREGEKGATWQGLVKGLPDDKKNFGMLGEALKAGQMQSTFQILDSYRTDNMPAAPSTMLKDLMNRPEFYEGTKNQGLIEERGTMGGFVASAAASGGFGNEVQNLVKRANQSFVTYRAQTAKSVAVKGEALRNQPMARFAFMVKAIPGLTDADEAHLLGAVKAAIPAESTGVGILDSINRSQTMGQADSQTGRAGWKAIESTILNGKFEDPRAEALRKKVAKDWSLFHESTEKLANSSWFGGN
jgi:hypothetical protein